MTWFQKPILGTPLDWENPLNRDLVLAYALNEGHGDKVQDLSLNGNHGTLNNFAFPPTVASGWNPGQTGVGLNFDGVNDYIDCGNNPVLDITDAITISMLINLPRTQHSNIFGKNYSSAWSMYVHTDGRAVIHAHIGGAVRTDWLVAAAGTVPANKRILFTWTYDSITAKIYIDGNAVPVTQTHVGVLGTNASNLHLGARSPAALYAKGSIDQPRIQSRAWSAKEVKSYAINPWQVYLDEND